MKRRKSEEERREREEKKRAKRDAYLNSSASPLRSRGRVRRYHNRTQVSRPTGQPLPQLFRDERHKRVDHAEHIIQASVESVQCGLAQRRNIWIGRLVVHEWLHRFQVHVAELFEDEVLEREGGVAELELLEARVRTHARFVQTT